MNHTTSKQQLIQDDQLTPAPIRKGPHLAALIPPLSPNELAQLETSLLRDGCRDPLLVWKGHNLLLDGHNRLNICQKHYLTSAVVSIALPDRQAAEAFIINNQFGRRNLSSEAASYLRGKRYLAEKQRHGGDRFRR